MKEQTAVEFLYSELERCQYFIGNDIFYAYEKALDIEQKQLYESYLDGMRDESENN